jgi:hypothetical protein
LATCKDAGQAIAFGELSVSLGGQETPLAAADRRRFTMVGNRKRLSGDSRRSSEKAFSRVLQGTVARMFLADNSRTRLEDAANPMNQWSFSILIAPIGKGYTHSGITGSHHASSLMAGLGLRGLGARDF